MASSKNRPVHEIRLGRVKSAIWRNETEQGPRYSVLITRIFKTDDGWDSSASFGRDELPLVAKVADMAHTWIFMNVDREEPTDESGKQPAKSRSREQSRAS